MSSMRRSRLFCSVGCFLSILFVGLIFIDIEVQRWYAGFQLSTTNPPVSGLRVDLQNVGDASQGKHMKKATRKKPILGPDELYKTGSKGSTQLPFYTFTNSEETIQGRSFNVSIDAPYLRMPKTFITLTKDNVEDFVFATAASSNHFVESLDAISLAQKYKPGAKIVYYDLGLEEDQRSRLRQLCDVELRALDYSKYPGHVSKLRSYAFKPMCIKEVLDEEVGVMWMDASFRLQTSQLQPVYDKVLRNGGLCMFRITPHSNFAATHPGMYEFIPSNVETLKTTKMYGANSVLFYRTESIYRGIFKWWILCAIDNNCMNPGNSTKHCPFAGDYMTTEHYPECHRQDQSALNVLIANHYHFNTSEYHMENPTKFVVITRSEKRRAEEKVCSKK